MVIIHFPEVLPAYIGTLEEHVLPYMLNQTMARSRNKIPRHMTHEVTGHTLHKTHFCRKVLVVLYKLPFEEIVP